MADRAEGDSRSGRTGASWLWPGLLVLMLGETPLLGLPFEVQSHQKVSDTQGNFAGVLGDSDRFGQSLASLDDLDGGNRKHDRRLRG